MRTSLSDDLLVLATEQAEIAQNIQNFESKIATIDAAGRLAESKKNALQSQLKLQQQATIGRKQKLVAVTVSEQELSAWEQKLELARHKNTKLADQSRSVIN